MTYVRTKIDIVEVDTIADLQTKVIWKDNFVKQSDNIEELFDWLVFKKEGTIMALYQNYDIAVQCEGNHVLAFDEVIGAIETKTGLIYCAKMDKEGGWKML